MKKILLLVVGSVMMVRSATSAPPNQTFPNKAFENYDVRGDNKKEGLGSLAAYREKAAATMDPRMLGAVQQLLVTGRSDLLSRIRNLRFEDNLFGPAPEIV